MTMRIRMTGALTALALLAGCGGGAGVTAALQGAIAPLVGTQAAPAGGAAAAAPADPATSRRVEIAALGLSGTARQVIDNGASKSFSGPAGFTYTLRDGMLVSTRGLGPDLMAADTRQSRAALRAGGGQAVRVHETLDGLDRIERAEFNCTVSLQGTEAVNLGNRQVTARRFDEECQGTGLIFTNYYWLDAAGEIISSRQFISQSVAYLRSNDL
ncbi:MAG: YjbF family lipoprotein [Limimaricola soesokkakensis]|uniref:YjbF family lipoprotein n=2 Tax=Limimaricola soesokkakensis TaxID=1343159 RepID=UPI0040594478